MPLPNSSVPWPPQFVLNQPVTLEEDSHTEFKEVASRNPASTIIDTVEDYAVAFLNGTGGRILWGIRDQDRFVVGVSLMPQLATASAKMSPASSTTSSQQSIPPVTIWTFI